MIWDVDRDGLPMWLRCSDLYVDGIELEAVRAFDNPSWLGVRTSVIGKR